MAVRCFKIGSSCSVPVVRARPAVGRSGLAVVFLGGVGGGGGLGCARDREEICGKGSRAGEDEDTGGGEEKVGTLLLSSLLSMVLFFLKRGLSSAANMSSQSLSRKVLSFTAIGSAGGWTDGPDGCELLT